MTEHGVGTDHHQRGCYCDECNPDFHSQDCVECSGFAKKGVRDPYYPCTMVRPETNPASQDSSQTAWPTLTDAEKRAVAESIAGP